VRTYHIRSLYRDILRDRIGMGGARGRPPIESGVDPGLARALATHKDGCNCLPVIDCTGRRSPVRGYNRPYHGLLDGRSRARPVDHDRDGWLERRW
jgi:hypothetical protein